MTLIRQKQNVLQDVMQEMIVSSRIFIGLETSKLVTLEVTNVETMKPMNIGLTVSTSKLNVFFDDKSKQLFDFFCCTIA